MDNNNTNCVASFEKIDRGLLNLRKGFVSINDPNFNNDIGVLFRVTYHASINLIGSECYDAAYYVARGSTEKLASWAKITLKNTEKDLIVKDILARLLGLESWCSIFIAQPEIGLESIAQMDRIVSNYSLVGFESMQLNKAHLLLMTKQPEAASKLYERFSSATITQDFSTFESAGLCKFFDLSVLEKNNFFDFGSICDG